MTEFALRPHPDFPSVAIDSIAVGIGRDEGRLSLRFRLTGALDDVVWPRFDGAAPRWADRLWQHTCFEAFAGAAGRPDYVEFNFAPSRRWAAYAFDGPRAGMRPLNGADVLFGASDRSRRDEWRFGTFPVFADAALDLNLAAVIEAKDGTLSYWALAHAAGLPDFHNRDCFIAALPAPGRP